jgi:hypothetical protein
MVPVDVSGVDEREAKFDADQAHGPEADTTNGEIATDRQGVPGLSRHYSGRFCRKASNPAK